MRLFIALITGCYLFTACGDGATNSASITGDAGLDATINAAEKELGYVSSGTSCLGKEGKSLCDFIDPALIEKYLPTGGEIKGYKDTERSMLSGCGVSIDHPTKKVEMTIAGSKMMFPAAYKITLYALKTHDSAEKAATRFRGEFKTLTQEEADQMRERLNAGIQGKVDAGELTEEQAKMSKGFGNLVGKSIWEPVQGVGDLAVWGNALPDKEPATMGTLAVLHGDTKFSLDVDLLESKDKSREAAIALAKSIIAACD